MSKPAALSHEHREIARKIACESFVTQSLARLLEQAIEEIAARELAPLLAENARLRAAIEKEPNRKDTERLDWLDGVNQKANGRNGTRYGWKFDINHNRAALTDCNCPALSIREAIDAAMKPR
jgi:hypothetical protein